MKEGSYYSNTGLQQRTSQSSARRVDESNNEPPLPGGVLLDRHDETTKSQHQLVNNEDDDNINKKERERRRKGSGLMLIPLTRRSAILWLYAFAAVTVSTVVVLLLYVRRHNNNHYSTQQLPPGAITTNLFGREKDNERNTNKTTYLNNPSSSTTKRQIRSRNRGPTTTKVAFAISVTGCGSKFPIGDPAAVLKHSIHRASSRGALGGRYDYDAYAIYHSDAEECALPLRRLGYKLLKRNAFVQVQDIQGKYLRERMPKSGCCGEKELIKFEAYTLTDYPVVVLLDLDSLVLQPMDDIFDVIILGTDGSAAGGDNINSNKRSSKKNSIIVRPNSQPLPKPVNAFYTYDYSMIQPGEKSRPVQGGFLAIRPSLAVYEELKEIVRIGDFRKAAGWGGSGVGLFWGGVTFQGLVPYYYDILHPGQSIELSHCMYNNMNGEPKKAVASVNGTSVMKCLTGEDECEDCREQPLKDIVSAHFTAFCGKPWDCKPHNKQALQSRSCRRLVHEWYKARSELEQSWQRSGKGVSTWEGDHFHGYCNREGIDGYSRIKEPYGTPIEMKDVGAQSAVQ